MKQLIALSKGVSCKGQLDRAACAARSTTGQLGHQTTAALGAVAAAAAAATMTSQPMHRIRNVGVVHSSMAVGSTSGTWAAAEETGV